MSTLLSFPKTSVAFHSFAHWTTFFLLFSDALSPSSLQAGGSPKHPEIVSTFVLTPLNKQSEVALFTETPSAVRANDWKPSSTEFQLLVSATPAPETVRPTRRTLSPMPTGLTCRGERRPQTLSSSLSRGAGGTGRSCMSQPPVPRTCRCMLGTPPHLSVEPARPPGASRARTASHLSWWFGTQSLDLNSLKLDFASSMN